MKVVSFVEHLFKMNVLYVTKINISAIFMNIQPTFFQVYVWTIAQDNFYLSIQLLKHLRLIMTEV